MITIPTIAFLAAALLCSLIGRALLVNAAFRVSAGWGFTVLFVPFGPLFFRLNYREQAYPTRYWRLPVGPLMLLFFLNGGTCMTHHSLSDFKALWKPAGKAAPIEAGDTHFHLPVPSKVVAAALGQTDPAGEAGITNSTPPKSAAATPAAATPAPTAATLPTATSAPIAATVPIATPAPPAAAPVPTATPTQAVAAAAAAMPVAPKILSMAERLEANRREFERLAEWYDNLRHERGYLRKGDTAAVEAFNVEAAKYQAALELAKSEQAELTKLTAKK